VTKWQRIVAMLGRAVGFSLTTVALVLAILRFWPDELQHRAVIGSLAAAAMVAVFLEVVSRRRLDEHHAEMKKLFSDNTVREKSWTDALSAINGRITGFEGRLKETAHAQSHDHAKLEEVRAVLRIKGWLPSVRESDED